MTKYQQTYGGALYDLAAESEKQEQILGDLGLIKKMLKEEDGYQKLVFSPAIEKEEKKGLLREAWQGCVDEYTMSFLCLLCDNNALSEVLGCIEEYENRYKIDRNIFDVVVTSAVALSESQKTKLSAAIEKKTGKKVALIEKVDPSVMAGLKLAAGGKEYDGTVASHLREIENILAKN